MIRASPKPALRAAIRAARRGRALDGPGRAQAARALADAASGLLATLGAQSPESSQSPEFSQSSESSESPESSGRWRVAVYASTRTEPPTEALRAALRAAGHEVLLPVVVGPRTLHWRLDGHEEICGRADGLATCDVVLTPGLAVDASGLRLGQGGGYYDAALAHVRPGVPVLTVLWDDEFVAGPLPAEAHDRRVHGVLTPGRGVLWIRPRADPADIDGSNGSNGSNGP